MHMDGVGHLGQHPAGSLAPQRRHCKSANPHRGQPADETPAVAVQRVGISQSGHRDAEAIDGPSRDDG